MSGLKRALGVLSGKMIADLLHGKTCQLCLFATICQFCDISALVGFVGKCFGLRSHQGRFFTQKHQKKCQQNPSCACWVFLPGLGEVAITNCKQKIPPFFPKKKTTLHVSLFLQWSSVRLYRPTPWQTLHPCQEFVVPLLPFWTRQSRFSVGPLAQNSFFFQTVPKKPPRICALRHIEHTPDARFLESVDAPIDRCIWPGRLPPQW